MNTNHFRLMKIYLANVVTGSRIAFSLPLLFVSMSSVWFYILYLLCGFTDVMDGAIARKTGTSSNFGARLDTISDFVFMFVCSIKILPLMRIPVWLWVWMLVVALIKMLNMAIVFIHKKKLIAIHSVLNKITGLALFLLPLLMTLVETTHSVATVCALATMAAVQEVSFIVKGQEIV